MEIIITGSSGRIGSSFVAHALRHEDYSLVLNYHRPESVPHEVLNDSRCRIVIGDIEHVGVVEELFSTGASAIIHLGTGIHHLLTSPWNLAILEQGKSTAGLIDFLKDYTKPCHLIFPSSGGTVYAGTPGIPFKESDHPRPCTPYGAHKVFMEECLRLLVLHNPQISCNVLRISNPYGMTAHREKRQGIIDILLDNVAQGLSTEIWTSMDTVRDFLHIDDLNTALCKALSYRNGFEIFNIGSGHGTSLQELVTIIENIKNIKLDLIHKKNKENFYPAYNVLDIAKARSILEWFPSHSLAEHITSLMKGK